MHCVAVQETSIARRRPPRRTPVKLRGEHNLHRHDLIAPPRAFEMRHSHAAEAEHFAATGLWGDPHRRLAIHGGDVDLRPQCRLGDADRHLAVQVVTLPFEVRVRSDPGHDVEVSGRATPPTRLSLPLDPDVRAVLCRVPEGRYRAVISAG